MKSIKISAIEYVFKPSDTINSVIRYHNNDIVSSEIMQILNEQFSTLNGQVNPRPGETYKIPVLENNNG